MIFYPAIDLKNGTCVRLLRGEMEQATVFNHDPAAQARLFQEAGAEWLHVVDLDGAFAGDSRNRESVQGILAATAMPLQLGGGIRSLAAIEGWLAAGVSRVILGTLAVKQPDIVREACRRFPGQIAIGIDAKQGMVAVEGWAETSELTALELARRLEDAGAAALIFTDIDRDGLLGGPNVKTTAELAAAVAIPVIASGGVSKLDDLRQLRREIPRLNGVISGRALYDGRLDLAAALAVLKGGD
ncbi:MAG: 1-(5-phosphoribosyl)-5-[(5-phosphoribosylamino)methylideneamino]imidazole-4-carboxamide isomerase [Candidatus Pacebacteria bacterium]|nr:1-(5-phosphoribosyl)-5-[(5-phosphoribosylamino)methylideneamino]imidazole-4-carboxamide isomerase [Candidatus Paceibacterota bacterium]